jgi:nucleotide-binding universal stress UspA family protein
MYGNILLSTDGSDVARKGVKHGIALAKALNAKVTVITVTEPLAIDYGSGHASGWIPSQEEVDRFDAACKERAGKALDEARAMAEQSGVSSELLHIPNAHPATAINGKVQRLRLDRHGISWASRPQEAIFGESDIGGPSGRKRPGVGSSVAITSSPVSAATAKPPIDTRVSAMRSSMDASSHVNASTLTREVRWVIDF